MTSRTRYFLTGSAVVVALCIGTGLVAYYRGDLPLFKAKAGPAELRYVPADATGVAFANVQDIMNSEFRQKLRTVLPTGEGKDEFFQQTGIDIERDIQSVVAASTAMPAGQPAAGAIVIIRGSFDEGRIETLIRSHGGTVDDYKGRRMLVSPDRESMSLVFPESGLAMFGTAVSLKRAIDTAAGRENVTSNDELMRLVGQIDGGGNTAWAVGNLDAVTQSPSVPQQVKDQMPGIKWVAVAAHVNGGVTGLLRAEAKDDKAAADLRAVVNGAIAAGRLVGGKDARLDALFNSVQVAGSGKDISVTFSVPPDVLAMVGAVDRALELKKPH